MSEKTPPVLRESATFDRLTIQEIQRAAETGIYDTVSYTHLTLPTTPYV